MKRMLCSNLKNKFGINIKLILYMEVIIMSKTNENEVKRLLVLREDAEDFEKISTIAQEILRKERGITATPPALLTTITFEYIRSIFAYLSKEITPDDDEVVLNFGGMLEFGISNRVSKDGEKSGNFVPFVNCGQLCKTAIKNDEKTEDEDSDSDED